MKRKAEVAPSVPRLHNALAQVSAVFGFLEKINVNRMIMVDANLTKLNFAFYNAKAK